MDTKRISLLALVPAMALLGLAGRSAEPPSAPADAQLEPITVTAPANPMDRSLQMLRILAARSTPCLGCDAVLREPTSPRAMTALKYLLAHRAPDQVDETGYLMVETRLHDAPELEYLKP